MSFISPALKSLIKLRKSVMDNFLLNPIDTQKQVFNKLISSKIWSRWYLVRPRRSIVCTPDDRTYTDIYIQQLKKNSI